MLKKYISVALSSHTMPNKLKSPILSIKELKGNMRNCFSYSVYIIWKAFLNKTET